MPTADDCHATDLQLNVRTASIAAAKDELYVLKPTRWQLRWSRTLARRLCLDNETAVKPFSSRHTAQTQRLSQDESEMMLQGLHSARDT